MAVTKAKIVSELAGHSLLLPDLIADALAANGRIKFALSWLQTAEETARGARTTQNLETERTLVGLGADPLYSPPLANLQANGIYIAGASRILARLLSDLDCMCNAVEAGAPAVHFSNTQVTQFRKRERSFRDLSCSQDDIVPFGLISMLSSPGREGKDSLHLLVMELHKALNAIAAALAEEDVGGARVYRLQGGDRERIAAFMRGLNRTAALKFDHPGLATTATHDGKRLIIQNDIGTTDTHVLIAYVEGLEVSITYSDIHARRLEFFRHRLSEFSWTIANRRSPDSEDEMFYLATGVLDAKDEPELERALEHLGATLVFLIDWNKARKSLRQLVSKDAATEILDWSAEQEIGHRAFLEVGGDTLISDLLGAVSKATGSFYASLKGAVGAEGAVEFIKEAMRLSSNSLKAGRSAQAVRDLLRAELLTRLASVADRILDIALDHGALVLDLGNLFQSALLDPQPRSSSCALLGRNWEGKADQLVAQIRDIAGTGNERAWREIASAADDIADAFEEALFRLQYLPDAVSAEIKCGLSRLSEHAVVAVKEYIRLLAATRHIHRGAPREDMQAFFDLLERQHEMEHATDEAERAVFAIVMRNNVDAKTLIVATSIAEALEKAGDALLHTSRLVADHTLGDWLAA